MPDTNTITMDQTTAKRNREAIDLFIDESKLSPANLEVVRSIKDLLYRFEMGQVVSDSNVSDLQTQITTLKNEYTALVDKQNGFIATLSAMQQTQSTNTSNISINTNGLSLLQTWRVGVDNSLADAKQVEQTANTALANTTKNEDNISNNVTEIVKAHDSSEANSTAINGLTADKANKTDLTALTARVVAIEGQITQIAWNPQYHEWQTFLAGLDTDGNNNESSDYPPVNEPFNYALNKKYKLLDIDEAGYIMGIKTNLTEERLCFIDKLNLAGDLIRSTQTSDDWIVDAVCDFDTKVTTISVDFKKDTIRDFKLTLMRLEDRTSDTTLAKIKQLITDQPAITISQLLNEVNNEA